MTEPYDMSAGSSTPCCEHRCSVCGGTFYCYGECQVAHQIEAELQVRCAVCDVDEDDT